jgi:methionyl-tRNA synthetase
VKATFDPQNEHFTQRTIFFAAEELRIVGILLQPFMPEKAAQLLDILGVSNDRRTLKYAQPFTDFDYGTPTVVVGKAPWGSLFPPLVEG